MTFDATVNPIVYEGGIPVFIDTEGKYYLHDVEYLYHSDMEEVVHAKAIKRHLQDNFYHKDIAPYSELLQSSKQYDTAIVTNILDVMRNV